QLITSISADLNGIPLFERLKEVAEVIYGSNLSIFPDVGLANPAEVKACYAGRQMIANAGPDVIDDWMREASLVRKYLRVYRNSSVLTEILSTGNKIRPLTVLQLPFFGNITQPWIGNTVP